MCSSFHPGRGLNTVHFPVFERGCGSVRFSAAVSFMGGSFRSGGLKARS